MKDLKAALRKVPLDKLRIALVVRRSERLRSGTSNEIEGEIYDLLMQGQKGYAVMSRMEIMDIAMDEFRDEAELQDALD